MLHNRCAPGCALQDDHDFGENDGGNYWPYRETAQQMFNNFWDVPLNDSRRHRPGVYSSDIQVCALSIALSSAQACACHMCMHAVHWLPKSAQNMPA